MRSAPLMNAQVRAGVWEGEIAGTRDTPPAISVMHLDTPLPELSVVFDDSRNVWRIRVPIPGAVINDGMQTLVMRDAAGVTLGILSLVAGASHTADLRTEVALLRQELDLLKKAFRSHCSEN